MPDGRRLEYLSLDVLAASTDPRNPKAHDTDLVESSIDRFGFVEPVVLDERTGRLVSGHGRVETLRTMKEAGALPPDGVELVEGFADWMVPAIVGWASRSDAEAAAALVALNRTTEVGGWDERALTDLLERIDEANDWGLSGTGYDEADLDDLRARLGSLGEDDGHVVVEGVQERGLSPEDETEYGDDLDTDYRCPRCSYEWSGSPAPGPRAEEDGESSSLPRR